MRGKAKVKVQKISKKQVKSYDLPSGLPSVRKSFRPNPLGVTVLTVVNGRNAYANRGATLRTGKTREETIESVIRSFTDKGISAQTAGKAVRGAARKHKWSDGRELRAFAMRGEHLDDSNRRKLFEKTERSDMAKTAKKPKPAGKKTGKKAARGGHLKFSPVKSGKGYKVSGVRSVTTSVSKSKKGKKSALQVFYRNPGKRKARRNFNESLFGHEDDFFVDTDTDDAHVQAYEAHKSKKEQAAAKRLANLAKGRAKRAHDAEYQRAVKEGLAEAKVKRLPKQTVSRGRGKKKTTIPVAFGPYKRDRVKVGRGSSLTYFSKKKKIPDWALVGAPSEAWYRDHKADYAAALHAIEAGRQEAASHIQKRGEALLREADTVRKSGGKFVANKKPKKTSKKSGKKAKKVAAKKPSKKTSKKSGKKASKKASKKTSKKAAKKPSKKGGKKGGKKAAKKPAKKKAAKKSGGKRTKADRARAAKLGWKRKKARGGKKAPKKTAKKAAKKPKKAKANRRRSHRRHYATANRRHYRKAKSNRRRRSHRGIFRRNGSIVSALKSGVAALVGVLVHRNIRRMVADQLIKRNVISLTTQGAYATAALSLGIAALGSWASTKLPKFGTEVATGMIVSALLDVATTVVGVMSPTASMYLNGLGLGGGIPSVNTSGWGSYELQGLNSYELQGLGGGYAQAAAGLSGGMVSYGMGASMQPMQAAAGYGLASYELQGMGEPGSIVMDGLLPNDDSVEFALNAVDTPMQAAAGFGGGYAQAAAGVGDIGTQSIVVPGYVDRAEAVAGLGGSGIFGNSSL